MPCGPVTLAIKYYALILFFQLCLRRPVERRGIRNTRPSVRLVETDADVSRPAIEEIAELKRQNELLRQQMQQSVSLPSTSSSPQQSSSLYHLCLPLPLLHFLRLYIPLYLSRVDRRCCLHRRSYSRRNSPNLCSRHLRIC